MGDSWAALSVVVLLLLRGVGLWDNQTIRQSDNQNVTQRALIDSGGRHSGRHLPIV
jgi:hypothetical protein